MTTPTAFPFPFPPYKQQQDLMEAIYECVDSSSVGCFESPTGTGKSLSAICSTLYWQSKEEQRILAEQEAAIAKRKAEAAMIADDWMMAFQVNHENETVESKEKTRAFEAYRSMTERIHRISLEDPKQRLHDHNSGKSYTGFMQQSSTQTLQRGGTELNKQANMAVASTSLSPEPEDEFALGDYDSDDDVKGRSKSNQRKGNKNKTLSVMDDEDDSDADDDDVSGLKGLKLPQIFYCSRTHSQISQFVSEIKRTVFANTRVVTLGSRRNLCINPVVSALKVDSKISERCLELQKSKEKKDCTNACSNCPTVANPQARNKQQKTKVSSAGPCTFHQRRKEQTLADYTLAKIRDIEDIVTLGTQVAACPYYATRTAVHSAQVVCMPYNMLLHEDLRTSMGIHLDNAVVIFDEAHNLVDAVNHIHSADVSSTHLALATHAIDEYTSRFQAVLTGKNYFYLNVLKSVINGLKKSLKVVSVKSRSNHNHGNVGIPVPGLVPGPVTTMAKHSSEEGSSGGALTANGMTATAGGTEGGDGSSVVERENVTPDGHLNTVVSNLTSSTATLISSSAASSSSSAAAASQQQQQQQQQACQPPHPSTDQSQSNLPVPSQSSQSKLPVSSQTSQSNLSAPAATSVSMDVELMGTNDFMFRCGLDNINLFKLRRHMNETNLTHKVGGYADHAAKKKQEAEAAAAAAAATTVPASGKGAKSSTAAGSSRVNTAHANTHSHSHFDDTSSSSDAASSSSSSHTAALRSILTLLDCLTNADADGRICVSKPKPQTPQTQPSQPSQQPQSQLPPRQQQQPASQSKAHGQGPGPSQFSSSLGAQDETASVPSIQYLLLNPSAPFLKVIKQARSVVLLGGTLQPFNYIKSFLFPHVGMGPTSSSQSNPTGASQISQSTLTGASQISQSTLMGASQISRPASSSQQLRLFSCGHVVDKANIAPMVVGQGPSYGSMDFTHEKRLLPTVTNELLACLIGVGKTVPKGMVVFFTSYKYMSALVARWTASGQLDLLARSTGKKVLIEPRQAVESERVWQLYSDHISAAGTGGGGGGGGTSGSGGGGSNSGSSSSSASDTNSGGAMLLCVMGGKLSEGINFSDDLARAVVVVGMPFPDGRDPVLQERLRFVETLEHDAQAGRRLYEALCMKTVNQCIGRAIRHANDHAAIVLLDGRYGQARIREQLPQWLNSEVQVCASFSEAQNRLTNFFLTKRGLGKAH